MAYVWAFVFHKHILFIVNPRVKIGPVMVTHLKSLYSDQFETLLVVNVNTIKTYLYTYQGKQLSYNIWCSYYSPPLIIEMYYFMTAVIFWIKNVQFLLSPHMVSER